MAVVICSALQHFECSNAIEIHNGIMLDFYPGLPHTYLGPLLHHVDMYSCAYVHVNHVARARYSIHVALFPGPVRPNAPHTHNVSHHDGFGIASQGILQEACQLRVSIWNVRAFAINLGRRRGGGGRGREGEGGEKGRGGEEEEEREEDEEGGRRGEGEGGGVVKGGRGREEKVRGTTSLTVPLQQ